MSKVYRNFVGPIGLIFTVIYVWPFLWLLSQFALVERIEITIFLLLFYVFFPTRQWATFSKQGPWNIIPTIVIYISVFLIGVPAMILGACIHAISPKKYSYFFVDVFFRIFGYLLGISFCQLNENPIPKNETVVCVCNHSGFIDSILSVLAMHARPWSVAAAWKMFFIPPFCFFLWRHSIPLRRKDIQSLHKFNAFMLKCIDKNISPLLFIEGTRPVGITIDEPMGEVKNGAFKFARLKNKRIVPIVFVWPKLFKDKTSKSWWINPQPIYCYFCEPVVSDGNAKKSADALKITMVSVLKKYMPVWAK